MEFSHSQLFAHASGLVLALALGIGGRFLLACLPPGRPGGHALRELPTTLAVSVLLGCFAGTLLLQCARFELGTRPPVVSFGLVAAWSILALALLFQRWVGGLRAMVPRHEPALPREPGSARIALFVAGTALACVCVSSAWSGLFTRPTYGPLGVEACVMLFAPILLWALRTARCHALAQAAALLALVAIAVTTIEMGSGTTALVAAGFGAALAASVAWYRRADRRALLLAVVSFAAILLFDRDAWLLAVAGWVGLVLGTPAASRMRVTTLSCVGAGVTCTVRAWSAPEWPPAYDVAPSAHVPYLIVILYVPIVVAWWLDARRRGASRDDPSGAPPGHERSWILRTVLLALLGAYATRTAGFAVRFDAILWPALFALTLVFGLSVQRIAFRR